MKVKMRTNIACAEITASAGDEIVVSRKLGQQLLTGGYAEAVKEKKENATLPAAENATTDPAKADDDGNASPGDSNTADDSPAETDENAGDETGAVKLKMLDPELAPNELPSYAELKVMAKELAPDADVQHNTAKKVLIEIINDARTLINEGLDKTDEE